MRASLLTVVDGTSSMVDSILQEFRTLKAIHSDGIAAKVLDVGLRSAQE